jgi:hypothetical protein
MDRNMGEVIKLSDRVMPWREVMVTDSEISTLYVYMNDHDKQVEIFQLDDQGKGIRTILNRSDAEQLAIVMQKFLPIAK